MKKLYSFIYVLFLVFSLSNNSVNESKDISNIDLKVLNANATNGSYEFSYSITPTSASLVPGYVLTCTNTSIDPLDYYSVSIDGTNKTCKVTNLLPCNYQVKLKLYSGDAEAYVNLDYKKRVTGINSYFYQDRQDIFFHSSVKYGTGSITPSYSIDDESISYDSTFVSNIKTLIKPVNDSTNTYSNIIYYGLDNQDADYWLGGDFDAVEFTNSIYVKYRRSYMDTSDYVMHITNGTTYLYSFENNVDYEHYFNGQEIVFNYQGKVNGITYTSDIGLPLV